MQDINELIKNADNDNQNLLSIARIIYNIGFLSSGMTFEDFNNLFMGEDMGITEALGVLAEISPSLANTGNNATKTDLEVTLSDNSTDTISMYKSGKMRYIEGNFEITFTNLTKDSLGFFKIGSMKDGLFHRFTCFIKDSSNNINAGMIRFDNDIKLYLNNDITELNGKYTIEYFGSWMEPYQD